MLSMYLGICLACRLERVFPKKVFLRFGFTEELPIPPVMEGMKVPRVTSHGNKMDKIMTGLKSLNDEKPIQ